MTPSLLDQAQQLSVDARIELVEAIWESIASDANLEQLPLAEGHRLELDRRLAELETDPGSESSWDAGAAQ